MAHPLCTTTSDASGTGSVRLVNVYDQSRLFTASATYHGNVDLGWSPDTPAMSTVFRAFATAVNLCAERLKLDVRISDMPDAVEGVWISREEAAIAGYVAGELTDDKRGPGMRQLMIIDINTMTEEELRFVKNNAASLAAEFNNAAEKLRLELENKRNRTGVLLGGAVFGGVLLRRLFGG